MADFTNINQVIEQNVTQNGEGLITGLILQSVLKQMLVAVGDLLDGKVDAVSGKGLSANDFTTALKNKLTAMPYITSYDATKHIVTIGETRYALTPYVPVPDYFVGFVGGSSANFRAMTVEQLLPYVLNTGGSVVEDDPTYSGTWDDDIIFAFVRKDVTSIASGTFISAAGGGTQPLVLDMNPAHSNVFIDGTEYEVKAYRPTSYNQGADRFTLTFTTNS